MPRPCRVLGDRAGILTSLGGKTRLVPDSRTLIGLPDRRSKSPPPCPCKGRRNEDGAPSGVGMSGRLQCGAVCVASGGLGGGVDDLSSLKIPAILPKKLFFFCGSVFCGSCPLAG